MTYYDVQYEHLFARGSDGLFRWHNVLARVPESAPDGARIVSVREFTVGKKEVTTR